MRLPQCRVPNRLSESTSPYLVAHADNPVDWYPWGDEAFSVARDRDVPVFLSVGYSACHWCHVMAHESFEDERVAGLLNEHFVNVKVDREELPAVDSHYMQATQALTGHGGWPMSVWLDHDRRPWYAGTYFPPVPSHSSPSFVQVLLAIVDAWRNERSQVDTSAARISAALAAANSPTPSGGWDDDRGRAAVAAAVEALVAAFDPVHGGFGGAPKFPPALSLRFLMRVASLERLEGRTTDPRLLAMVEVTCERMARGGMYDQLAGGFARYSVDATWTVPHFEKMLYDNAQLLDVYTQWYLHSGSALAERVARETAEFLLTEMVTAEGAFAAALDADSVNQGGALAEGAYYVFTPDHVREACGLDGDWAVSLFGVTAEGTFEHGASVLRLARDPEDWQRYDACRIALRRARGMRPAPARDDKVLAAWNGMAIAALSRAACVFDQPDWLAAATRAADLLIAVHLDPAGGLARTSRDGRVQPTAPGVLEDYAQVALGLAALCQADGDPAWLDIAQALVTVIRRDFDIAGEIVDVRPTDQVALGLAHLQIDTTDNVTPSGWAAAVDAALTVGAMAGDAKLLDWARHRAGRLVKSAQDHPRFAGHAAAVVVALLDGPREVAVANDALRSLVFRGTAPGAVVCHGRELPLLAGRVDSGLVYVCRGHVCDAPTADQDAIKLLLAVR